MKIIEKRRQLRKMAETGEISPKEYWESLKETWKELTPKDKAIELAELRGLCKQ